MSMSPTPISPYIESLQEHIHRGEKDKSYNANLARDLGAIVNFFFKGLSHEESMHYPDGGSIQTRKNALRELRNFTDRLEHIQGDPKTAPNTKKMILTIQKAYDTIEKRMK